MRTKLILLLALPVWVAGLFLGGCAQSESGNRLEEPSGKVDGGKYHCPMHPTYLSNKPGDCPICHMKIVPVKGQDEPAGGASQRVSERASILVAPEKQQLIGLRTSEVARRELSTSLRTTALVEHDETRLAHIAPRFGGWVRTLLVNATGAPVEQGQPLLTVYSPELLSAQKEHLLAWQRYETLAAQPGEAPIDPAQRMLEAARRRLALWEISQEEIRELERTRQPKEELLLRSPVSGYVISKTAVQGHAFKAGETLYQIGQLSPLWLRATVFELDLPLVKVGQNARVVLPDLGGRSFEGVIAFIYPQIDPQTRRAEIRLEVENPEHLLRPQMWATVEIEVAQGEVLSVPASSVIDTGTRHIAFVLREDNRLEPRELKIGLKTDDFREVLSGLQDGERVVTRALFLLDAESQLRAAIAGMETRGGRED